MTPAQKKLRLGNRTKKISRLDKQKRESVERSLLALPTESIDPLTDAVDKIRRKRGKGA
jgi:hypothetical protein